MLPEIGKVTAAKAQANAGLHWEDGRPIDRSDGLAANLFAAGSYSRCATIQIQMAWQHISDDDLERYYLGMLTDESELAPLEEHLLACPPCVKRAEEAQDRVDAIRAAITKGDFDLD